MRILSETATTGTTATTSTTTTTTTSSSSSSNPAVAVAAGSTPSSSSTSTSTSGSGSGSASVPATASAPSGSTSSSSTNSYEDGEVWQGLNESALHHDLEVARSRPYSTPKPFSLDLFRNETLLRSSAAELLRSFLGPTRVLGGHVCHFRVGWDQPKTSRADLNNDSNWAVLVAPTAGLFGTPCTNRIAYARPYKQRAFKYIADELGSASFADEASFYTFMYIFCWHFSRYAP